jgi:hypothetical protein
MFLRSVFSIMVCLGLISQDALAQDQRQQQVDAAISGAERVCLSGDRFKFDLKANGDLTILRIEPGVSTNVHIDKNRTRGGTFFDDPAIRKLVDDDIRTCMKQQWPLIIPYLISAERPFSETSATVNFGCEEDASASVTYKAPPGWSITTVNAAIVNSVAAKNQNARIVSNDGSEAVAVADFRGRDRELLHLNCPGGGSGAVLIHGTIVQK